MASLASLPHEILHHIFLETEPGDLGALSQTCHAFHGFIRKNRYLFKQVYLKLFVRCLYLFSTALTRDQDDRPPQTEDQEPAWEELLPRLVKVQKILASGDPAVKASKPVP